MEKKIEHVLNNTEINIIACIGETLQERQSGKTNEVVERQVKAYQSRRDIQFSSIDKISLNQYERVVFAYESVWAIGSSTRY